MATLLGNYKKLVASAKAATVVTPLKVGTTGMGPPDGTTAITTYDQDMTAIGNTIDRTYIDWSSVNPSSGTFNWTVRQGAPDLWYNTSLTAGRTLILQPIFSPSFWRQGAGTNWPNSVDGRVYADMPPFPSADWDFWLSKLVLATTAMATRYPSLLIIWEPGNEWNNAGIYHRPGGLVVAMTAANYAAYFAAQYNAIKAVNPGQKVIIGGLLRVDSAPPFSGNGNYSGIAALSALKTALDALGVTPDGVSIHPYMLGASNSDPTIDRGANIIGVNSFQSVKRCLDEMDRIGWHLPVYITETGFRASQSNAQGAFNCNSEATKTIWNLFEHHETFYQYTKAARGPGKAWVEAIMYYRDQEYPSPTSPTYSGAMTGDPPEGPHALNAWGIAKQDFTARLKDRLPIPTLDGITLTGVPSTVVVGASAATISAAGTNMACVPTLLSSDPSVVSVTTPATGSSTTTIQFLTPGKATIKAQSKNARGIWITAVQTVDVQSAVATTTTLSPASGWKVATSNSGTIQFVASVLDQLGNPMTASGAWTSSDPTNAPISSTGLLTAVGVVTGVTVTFTPDTGTAGGRIATSTGDVVVNPVLQLTNAPSDLFIYGAVALTVTDGASPVTGFTINISDPTKATASGADLIGKGGSGTFDLTVSKSGLTTSSVSVVACTSNAIFDDKDTIGQADGTSIASYTDADSIAWAQANGAFRPTYKTNVVNGHSTILFNGTNQVIKATATHPRLNGAGMTYMTLIRPTNAAPSVNEQILDNRDFTNTEGFVLGRNASAPNVGAAVLTYYKGSGTTSQQFDGTKMPSGGAFYRVSIRIKAGKQERMINGVIQTTFGSDAVYKNPVHTPLPAKGGGNSGGNFFEGDMACETLAGRALTDAEWLQADYYQELYATGSVGSGTDGPSLTGLAVLSDDYSYANTSAFQQAITTNIGGAGSGTVTYMDGANASWASLDTSVLYNGHHTGKYVFPSSTSGAAELWAPLPSPLYHMWFRGSIRFTPTFDSGGTNVGASGGYKIWAWSFGGGAVVTDGSGRCEATGGSGGAGADHYDFYWGYTVRSTGHTAGGNHITPAASLPAHWSSGDWIHYYLEMDHTNPVLGSAKLWIGVNDDTPSYLGQVTGTPSSDGEAMPPCNYICIGLNFNQTRDVGQDLQLNWGEWEVVDGSVHANPFML